MLHSLCFISNAVDLWPETHLRPFNNLCKLRNRLNGLTGVLIYCEGTFMEVIEGREAKLLSVFSEINNDDRLDQTTLMMNSPIEQRIFDSFYTASKSVNNLKLLYWLELRLQEQAPSKYTKRLQAIIKPFFPLANAS
ncbi:MAG TPA: BLUF domain-containing protein [Aequorivita sp.]|nr:BLUF domain-containing protein [Aequorivita sp.]